MVKRVRLFFLIASFLVSFSLSADFFLATGGEFRVHPETGGHGVALMGWRGKSLSGTGRLYAYWNTDLVAFGGYGFRSGAFRMAFKLEGEALLAGVLADYYRRGRKYPEYGFNGSYLFAELAPSYHFSNTENLVFIARLRKWFFSRRDSTDPELVLPGEWWTGEFRLRFTSWRLHGMGNASWRLYPRLLGRAWGIVAGMDIRSGTGQWGYAPGGVFADSRNDSGNHVFHFEQWFRGGFRLGGGFRLEIRERAVLILGGDDLVRIRTGGMNPYVVPVAGLPWAAFLTDTLLGVQAALVIPLHGGGVSGTELRLFLDGALLRDRERSDSDRLDSVWGGGLHLDMRFGLWQLDCKAGVALPGDWQAASPHLSFWLSVGKGF